MLLDTFVFESAGGREYNEDAAGIRPVPGGALCVLCDGLGGHRFGDLASKRALESLTAAPPPAPEDDAAAWLTERLERANADILALQKEKRSVMKSTAVALLLRGRKAAWAHVGDSRLYYFHGGELISVTEDHSVAYRKFKAGEIRRGEIATDPDQSSLLRALGNAERHQCALGETEEPLEPGDAFLLCSDGVWEYLPDGEALLDLLKADSARAWAELMLERVLSRVGPGNDNLSLITVTVQGETDEA